MRILFLSCFLIFPFLIKSQQVTIFGKVTDNETNEPLVGVNVVLGDEKGTVTDINGRYEISTADSRFHIEYRYIGYKTENRLLDLSSVAKKELNIKLQHQASQLDEVVISAGKFEQNRRDVSVSMEVVKTDFIENNLGHSIESTIQRVPGMMITDGQASIRGGSGYSYGAGSRVLLLVDGMPMMTGASGETKWDFIPTENVKQIEIIKGASSALYGSSALNGVVNVRTAFSGEKPKTTATVACGIYGNPERSAIKWWDKSPAFRQMNFSHARKFGKLELVMGAFGYIDDGYKVDENEEIYRFNLNTKYRFEKVKGLSASLNSSIMHKEGQMFLLWQDGDSGVYKPSLDYTQDYEITRFRLDPAIEYVNGSKSRHNLRTRYYRVENQNNTGQNNTDYFYYGEYQYQKYFKGHLNWTSGLSSNYIETKSELYGNTSHSGFNTALFTQLDKKFEKISFSLGGRFEAYRLNNEELDFKPVIRTGLNYELSDYSSLRASFGQGYRYPTVAERYTFTQVGSLRIFSNDTLQPEQGWSSELGYFHGYRIGKHKGVVDVALFWSEYQNMIEFMFGQHYPDWIDQNLVYIDTFIAYTGFKAYNAGDSRIYGLDLSLSGTGELGKVKYIYSSGYTYTNPVYQDFDPDKVKASTDQNILKYRFYHNIKFDIDFIWKSFSFGCNVDYHSQIINIDKAFEDSIRLPNGIPIAVMLPGFSEYRKEHSHGDAVVDIRFGYLLKQKHQFTFKIRNLMNREYMIRPADVQPPRNFIIQYNLKI